MRGQPGRRDRPGGGVLTVWLGIGVAYNLFALTSGALGDSRYFVPLDVLRREEAVLQPAHRFLDEHVPRNSRALLVGDATPYDLNVPALYNTVFDHSIFDEIAHDRSPAEVAQRLAASAFRTFMSIGRRFADTAHRATTGLVPSCSPRCCNV